MATILPPGTTNWCTACGCTTKPAARGRRCSCLTHGNGDNIPAWAQNIPYFARRYRVIAVDSRAHGKSVDVGDSLNFGMMANDFGGLPTSLRIDSACVLG